MSPDDLPARVRSLEQSAAATGQRMSDAERRITVLEPLPLVAKQAEGELREMRNDLGDLSREFAEYRREEAGREKARETKAEKRDQEHRAELIDARKERALNRRATWALIGAFAVTILSGLLQHFLG